MRDYVIVTDVTSDLPVNILETCDILALPMELTVGEQNYTHHSDARNLSYHDFYQQLRTGNTAKTTQINYATFMHYFEPIVQSGKDILYLGFSSGLSGTFQTSLIAANELMETYPGSTICCIDSLGASLGEGLFVYLAARKKTEGCSLSELKEWALDTRLKICHWFTVDDLNHLKRGGRISAASAVLGSALSIKPVLHVDNHGHLIPVSKVHGRKKSLKCLVEHMEKTITHPEEQTIFIGHGDCFHDAQMVKDLINEQFIVKDVIISDIGPVIGAHSGPGTVALFFVGDQR